MFASMFVLEIVAAILGVACVALLIVRNHWSWPIGFLQVIFTAIVLWNARLYAETGLQFVFAGLQVYGWWVWLARSEAEPTQSDKRHFFDAPDVTVERLKLWQVGATIVGLAAATAAIAWLLQKYTNGQAPVADAFVTAASLIAQFLLARKFWENWPLWCIVDVVSIALYISRGLFVFAALYLIFLGLAITGLIVWWRAWQNQMILQTGKP